MNNVFQNSHFNLDTPRNYNKIDGNPSPKMKDLDYLLKAVFSH